MEKVVGLSEYQHFTVPALDLFKLNELEAPTVTLKFSNVREIFLGQQVNCTVMTQNL